jgi:hypothetical protein
MIRKVLPVLLVLALPLAAQARQYAVRNGSQAYVAHTRMAPVVMHRALPPFKGQHVYAGRGER